MPFNLQSTAKTFPAVPGMLAGTILAKSDVGGIGRRETPSLNGILRSLQRDQEIYGEAGKAEHFFKIVSGVVRLCKFLGDGRRQIISFHFAGDIFGVESGAFYRVSAEAVSTCKLMMYRRRNLDTAATGNDDITRQMFLYAMRNAEQAEQHSLVLGRCSATEKVACFLRDQAQHSGNRREITLEMSRSDIADYLGLTIETISRTLSKLERDNVIELESCKHIHIKSFAALMGYVS